LQKGGVLRKNTKEKESPKDVSITPPQKSKYAVLHNSKKEKENTKPSTV
jgi:hypothetical protein